MTTMGRGHALAVTDVRMCGEVLMNISMTFF